MRAPRLISLLFASTPSTWSLAIALAAAAGAGAGELAEFNGRDGQGRTVESAVAGKPALVLITTPRLAEVGAQLRYLKTLQTEFGPALAVAAVVYGEEPATINKLREGMNFAVVAGEGKPPAGTFGDEEKEPLVLLVGRDGDVRGRLADVPDATVVAENLKLKFDAGPAGPPAPGQPVPAITLAASRGGPYELRARSQLKPKTVIFVFAMEDPARRDILADLQNLADDAGETVEVVPLMLHASATAAARMARDEYLDLPILVGGPLAAHRVVGKLELPVVVMAEEHGTVVGLKDRARVPRASDVLGEETPPAAEGEPVALVVRRMMQLTANLRSDRVPRAGYDGTGRYIIYSGHYAAGDCDHLYEMTIAGDRVRRISYAPAPDDAPAPSPDGVHVAFASARSGENELWICEREHGEFTQLTKSAGTYALPAYSADGSKILGVKKVRTGAAENLDIWVLSARGRREQPVTETFDDETEPAFSADGLGVFFAARRGEEWDIYAADMRGGRRRRLTDAGAEDRAPTPSPDGKYIVYASRKAGEPFKLWAMNVDGSSKVPLTSGPGNDLYADFAPDGAALTFVSDRTGSSQIYKMMFEREPDYDQPRPARPLAQGRGAGGESRL